MLSALLGRLKTILFLVMTAGSGLLLLLLKLKSNKVEQLEVQLTKVDDATELAPINQAIQEAESNVAKDDAALDASEHSKS